MEFIGIVKNIFSLGGEYRLEKYKEEYNTLYESYKEYCSELEPLNNESNKLKDNIHEYVEKITNIFKEFKLDKNVSEDNKISFFQNPEKYLLSKNLGELSSGEKIAVVGTSIATPVIAGSLVSMFGTASTGTAIATLQGSAWIGAITSWFAGGSVATGGFGVVVGSFILPSLALIPFTAYAYKSHKDANQLEEMCEKLKQELEKRLSKEEISEATKLIQGKISKLEDKKKTFENGLSVLCEDFAQMILLEMKDIAVGKEQIKLFGEKQN